VAGTYKTKSSPVKPSESLTGAAFSFLYTPNLIKNRISKNQGKYAKSSDLRIHCLILEIQHTKT
jgi:hypothetical protein